MPRFFQTFFIFLLFPVLIQADPVDHVNTLVGTLSKHSLSTGNTYPCVARPWGTHFWTPQTGKAGDGWTYVYTEDKIRGIKMTHQPSPWIGDYGQFSIMPVTTGQIWDEDQRSSWFSHKAEIATPYSYEVYLAEHDTYVELTPTEHAAKLRITYPEKDMSYLVIDAFQGGSKVFVDGNTISGYSVLNRGGVAPGFKFWFTIKSDTKFDCVKIIDADRSYAVVGFKTSRHQQVNLDVAASFISSAQSEYNLKELGSHNFDSLKAEGRKAWNEVLSRIEVQDNNIDNLRTFYSCLYRSLLLPHDLSEVMPDGSRKHYSPFDGKIYDGPLVTDNGFWDTFRCQFALLDLVYPEQAAIIQEGLVNVYKESGFLPEWASPGHRECMVGNNSASVVAEAYLKGLRGYDIETMWEALKSDAHSCYAPAKSTGRLGWEYYDKLGYIPCDVDIKESAARTLEYAYNDWCIWTLGKALGKSEAEIEPYRKASQNYRNLFRKEFNMMSGRKADGSFSDNFNPFKWGGDFTEGNALQYTWSVFHDPAGLADLMGGSDAFAAALDNIFEMPPIYDDSYYGITIHEIREMQIMNMGNYAHGNQPIQHMLYLYDWCAQPWKAQARIREVMKKFYSPTPDGYCGDEDCGQTSAWYIFSAMGFYPVCPASCEYALGSPLFDKMTVHLPSGKDIEITAKDNNAQNVYVDKLSVNGKPYTKNYITHQQLVGGAKISAVMTDKPNCTRGTASSDAPYSYSAR